MAGESNSYGAHGGPHESSIHIDWSAVVEWGLAILSGGMILIGSLFVLAGALGVLRMPDFFTRIHAAGMTDTLGAELIILGLMIQALAGGDLQMALKLLLVAFFLFLTSPTSTHAIANAAHKSGVKPLLGDYQIQSVDAIKRGEAGKS